MRAVLLMPQTFMNESGESVGPAASFYKVPPDRVLVVCDDINLPFGRLRFRRTGSDGGHNGLKSVIFALNTLDFPRLRVGIGREGDAIDHVIGAFNKQAQGGPQALPPVRQARHAPPVGGGRRRSGYRELGVAGAVLREAVVREMEESKVVGRQDEQRATHPRHGIVERAADGVETFLRAGSDAAVAAVNAFGGGLSAQDDEQT